MIAFRILRETVLRCRSSAVGKFALAFTYWGATSILMVLLPLGSPGDETYVNTLVAGISMDVGRRI
jgi:hypothetical protein